MSASARNGAKSLVASVVARRIDARQRAMAVDRGAAVAGDVLDDRQHAAGQQALADGAAERRDARGLVAVGAVADHGVGAGARAGRAPAAQSTVMPSAAEIVGDQPRAEPRRLLGRARRRARRSRAGAG